MSNLEGDVKLLQHVMVFQCVICKGWKDTKKEIPFVINRLMGLQPVDMKSPIQRVPATTQLVPVVQACTVCEKCLDDSGLEKTPPPQIAIAKMVPDIKNKLN